MVRDRGIVLPIGNATVRATSKSYGHRMRTKEMTLDFFMNTVGQRIRNSKARPVLTPEGRKIVMEKLDLTDEELDKALEALGERMTKQARSDMDALQEMADTKQAKLLADLRQNRDEQCHGTDDSPKK